MLIKEYISRISKLLFGMFLISITLGAESSQSSSVMLYSLLGIPFVLAGIFNWTPLVWLVEKTVEYFKPVFTLIKPRVKNA